MSLNRRAFLQQLGFGVAQAGLLAYLPSRAFAGEPNAPHLVRSLPEAQGVASSGILDFLDAVELADLNLHSLMVLRHGKVIAEGWWAPYAPDLKHTLYSLSKSFTSTAIGMAVQEGRLKVSDKVISFFPKDVPAKVSKNLSELTVKHLLTMSTGHAKDPTGAVRAPQNTNWVKAFFNEPLDLKPGSQFVYNSAATYMLSAIIQKLTGQTLLTYLEKRLFEPLDIKGADWETDPAGVCTGGWGLRLKTEDIAKFGQLYLQKGMWNGKRLIAESWINDATSFEIQSVGGSRKKEENDWLQGYGYQFWRCRHDGYRGDGAMGQYCVVIPNQYLVIAVTSETSNMQAIMDNMWDHILPAIKGNELPDDKSNQAKLRQRLGNLALKIPVAENYSSLIPDINGKSFKIDTNEMNISQVTFSFSPDACKVTLENDKGKHDILCGLGKWKDGFTDMSIAPVKLVPTPVPGETKTRVAASATWLERNTLELTLRYIETAHYEKVRYTFSGTGVKIEFKKSTSILSGTPDGRPALSGTIA